MKRGFTTGSCAAAAAAAATMALYTGRDIDTVSVMTPAGVMYETKVNIISRDEKCCTCSVTKPSCDDPDVTAGMEIRAKICVVHDGESDVLIDGGEGIGRVTKPGLDRPVGDAAINTVPRRMIEYQVREVLEEFGSSDSVNVEISAPEGRRIAEGTFNQRLGIEGGISIIGTTGIIEPMSTKAIIDTIRVELKQKKEMGEKIAVVSPGNYGFEFMKSNYGYDLDRAVKCSNYIGDTIDMARDLGFGSMLLVGHMGKLVKVAGGIMNTHSSEGDCRMEIMAASAIKAGGSAELAADILKCVSTEEAYRLMVEAAIGGKCMDIIVENIYRNLKKRAKDMEIACIVYSSIYGVLGATDGAERMLKL